MRCCGRRRAAGLCCLRLWRLNCAAVGNAGLQGFIACDCDDYTALRLAAQGCRATVPVAMATTLHCCEWPRAAGLYCLWLWRLHHAHCLRLRREYTPLLWAAQSCRASLLAAMATTLPTLLWAMQGCWASLPATVTTTLRCCERRRAAGLHCLRLWRGDDALLRHRAAGRHCLRLWRIHSVAVGWRRAAWRRASLPAAMANTPRCCGRRRAAELRCLRLRSSAIVRPTTAGASMRCPWR